MTSDEFTRLLEDHGDLAYRMACHLSHGNESLARDLVQDAFVKIWKNRDRHSPTSIKGWLYRILHNLYIDSLRRQGRQTTVSYDVPADFGDETLGDHLPDCDIDSFARLEQRELQEHVQAALRGLPEEYRLPIILCDMEDLSYDEIARILYCPVGTVRSRIHRGRRELRKKLEADDALGHQALPMPIILKEAMAS